MLRSSTDVMWPFEDYWWYMGEGAKMFCESFPRGSCWLPSVLHIAFQPVAVVPVNFSIFWLDNVFSLYVTGMFLEILLPLKSVCMSLQNVFDVFTYTLCIVYGMPIKPLVPFDGCYYCCCLPCCVGRSYFPPYLNPMWGTWIWPEPPLNVVLFWVALAYNKLPLPYVQVC